MVFLMKKFIFLLIFTISYFSLQSSAKANEFKQICKSNNAYDYMKNQHEKRSFMYKTNNDGDLITSDKIENLIFLKLDNDSEISVLVKTFPIKFMYSRNRIFVFNIDKGVNICKLRNNMLKKGFYPEFEFNKNKLKSK